MNVLVAEDNKNAMIALSIGLSRLGYAVTTVANGLEAIQALEQGNFDLVITDYRMPKLDGAGLVRVVQTKYPGLPILVISAYDLRDVRKKFKKSENVYFLSKPFELSQLTETIERIRIK
ncbi:MAG: response regulator [Calditrichaeota bacterium]|nr:response regulator [Calditrichota bacterium]